MDLRTGAAFWPLKDGLIAAYPPLERNETCDVAVIGAGITGALAAHRLAQADCDVILLDRHDVGMGRPRPARGCCRTRRIPHSANWPRRWASSAQCEAGAWACAPSTTSRPLCRRAIRLQPAAERLSGFDQVGRAEAEGGARARSRQGSMWRGWMDAKSRQGLASAHGAIRAAAMQRSMPIGSHTE